MKLLAIGRPRHEADAAARTGRLPLVQAGVVEFEVIELHPFAALALLFRETEDQ